MVAFDYKGGIGTASRLVGGRRDGRGVWCWRTSATGATCGWTACRSGGCSAASLPSRRGPAGSCIVVVATDAPLGPEQLTRLARRAGLGLARTGSVAHHGSGEIFLAFSTTARVPRGQPRPPALPDVDLDPLFGATVDATEEAVLNALWNAERTEGREGRVFEPLPHADVLELLEAHGRLAG